MSPRPPVGAVIISGGIVVGEGHTHATPGPHAEAAAIADAGARARGATMVVTLEPCVRSSVSVACAERILEAGITRVVAATRDPNPAGNGRGFRMLRGAGVDVRTGVLGPAARRRIEPFTKWITTGRPFVTLKLATTLDGKVAAPYGTSRWITGPEARAEVHDLRRRVDAVMVGAGTVEADDPSLTFRLEGIEGTQPLRVVLDSSGRTPGSARIFDAAAPALVLTTAETPADGWERAGADVGRMPRGDGGVDLGACLAELARRGMCHVLCEGGPTLAAALVASGLVDRCIFYLAPKLIGGDAPGALTTGAKTLTEAWSLEIERVRRVGDDIAVEARPATGSE